MRTFPLIQPDSQFGVFVTEMLSSEREYTRIIFISAFAALRTILRIREPLINQKNKGCHLKIVVGIDLGGTSKEVLEELLRWECESIIFHNASPRVTFHPKIYVFESNAGATIVIGSNNLTDGGFYTNYEAAICHEFVFPADMPEYERYLNSFTSFFAPSEELIRGLSPELIKILVARGQVPNEYEARTLTSKRKVSIGAAEGTIPPNPFGAVSPQLPPLLAHKVRTEDVTRKKASRKSRPLKVSTKRPEGVLVWRKKLPRTDALHTSEGSHHVGGVRLTQAKFEDMPGHVIDQTTYFRKLFSDYSWEQERSGHTDQEHTFVPMRVIIRGRDHGVRIFEVSHKPSGEAGQANYTTILRWGSSFTPTISKHKLTGSTLSLYDTEDDEVSFLLEIT